jgi:signal transduction histidine kinase
MASDPGRRHHGGVRTRIVWIVAGLTVVALVATVAIYAAVGISAVPGRATYLYFPLVTLYPVVGALVITSRPRNPIGYITLGFGICAAVQGMVGALADEALAEGWPAASWLALASVQIMGPAFIALVIAFPVLFPDGRPPTRRYGAALVAALAITGTAMLLDLLSQPDITEFGIANPAHVIGRNTSTVTGFVIAFCLVLPISAVVVRFRRSTGVEREQLKLFVGCAAIGFAIILLSLVVSFANEDLANALGNLAILFLGAMPLAAGVAIIRHGLYEIDVFVNRTLVYGILTACLVTFYAGIVFAVGELTSGAGRVVSVAAAAAAAILAAPLRSRVQTAVNRLLYGERESPYAALAGLGMRLEGSLETDAVLPAIVEAVSRALRVPYVAIELHHGPELVEEAAYGRSRGDATTVPLVHAGESIGRLLVSPRSPDEPLTDADRRLLADLARQAGPAVHGVRLSRELQRSREQLVAAREEERRRLRRDLHDGLGPQLAAIALRAGVVRNAASDEGTVEALGAIEDQIRTAIADVRRLVYDLRPPQLDELGLGGAIRLHADNLRSQLAVDVRFPDGMPALPAAVEVAAYRIATEAMTNVVRHADASRMQVDVRLNGDLEVEVRDDGRGLPASIRRGVGLTSMRERAEELGGSCAVTAVAPHGTRVHASLPVSTP